MLADVALFTGGFHRSFPQPKARFAAQGQVAAISTGPNVTPLQGSALLGRCSHTIPTPG